MKITFVKKILSDGTVCKKCSEVEDKLSESGFKALITETILAQEGDENSPGMQLAKALNVDKAPFFVVEKEGGEREVFTIYFKLVKDVLKPLAEQDIR